MKYLKANKSTFIIYSISILLSTLAYIYIGSSGNPEMAVGIIIVAFVLFTVSFVISLIIQIIMSIKHHYSFWASLGIIVISTIVSILIIFLMMEIVKISYIS